MPKKQKGSWIVTVKCVVEKSVVCDGCTEDEARNNPFRFSVQETETCMSDWDVMEVEPNE